MHRDSLRIYGIPEDKEGTDVVGFLDNLLKSALDFALIESSGLSEYTKHCIEPQQFTCKATVKFEEL